ncbi:MAG TPA: hypothetical protein VJ623_02890 [Holophagaceae bacterium]|nr:hypothetical protein [Holophagaceae bacterium]
MGPLPEFDNLAGVLEPPVREPAMRAAFQRLMTEGCLLDRLGELASAEDFRWRAYRAVALGQGHGGEPLGRLVEPLAGDPHGFVRASCAWALGQPVSPPDPVVDEALVGRIREDPVWAVGRRAALSLGRRWPTERLWAAWEELRSLPLLPWVRRGLVEALRPSEWTGDRVVAWLREGSPEEAEALLWAIPPARWRDIELPSDVLKRIDEDPWLKGHIADRNLSRKKD